MLASPLHSCGDPPRMKVLLTWCATEDEIARVREGLPADCTVVAAQTSSKMLRYDITHRDIADCCADVDAMMGWVVPPQTWDSVPGLKALAWLHAGCDELDYAMLRERAVQPGENFRRVLSVI